MELKGRHGNRGKKVVSLEGREDIRHRGARIAVYILRKKIAVMKNEEPKRIKKTREGHIVNVVS